jgi:hypothetical protein
LLKTLKFNVSVNHFTMFITTLVINVKSDACTEFWTQFTHVS